MGRVFTYLIRKLQHIFISEILRATKNDDKECSLLCWRQLYYSINKLAQYAIMRSGFEKLTPSLLTTYRDLEMHPQTTLSLFPHL